MIDRDALLKDLQRWVKALETDLREQVGEVTEVGERLSAEYKHAFKLKRTAATEEAWLRERITQVAVAWVLGTVFVRFCEDNGLLGNTLFIAGPDKDRLTLAEEAQAQFHRDHRGAETDRGWLLKAFEEMSQVQAGKLLFDQRHNPLYQIPVSQDAAMDLIEFWRRRDETGTQLVHDFTDPQWSTRFLGDLYQDLSESARKSYALLQTPEFVEEFILTRTLEPALNEFGHEKLKMIDPTCGSGHFLLGTFRRLLEEWKQEAPGKDVRERVRLALESVHGVDINPFAVAIARFRLIVEALRVAGFETLQQTAGYRFPIQVAVGDALIKSRDVAIPGMEEFGGTDALAEFAYTTEDVHNYKGLLTEGRYHVVVGNPPYVTVKDKELNRLYRELYSACAGSYALSVPFAQRFFQLAVEAERDGRGAGYVGQITANSFMKREFGRKLIESYFRYSVDVNEVIDTSGAFIPGHGTPTVILVGRRRTHHHHSPTVRAVLGIKGEPGIPDDPTRGKVWQAIVQQIDQPGSESEWVGSVDAERTQFSSPPWSLSGGGARELQRKIESVAVTTLGGRGATGTSAVTRENEAFSVGSRPLIRFGVPEAYRRPLVDGDRLRDWVCTEFDAALWPYDSASLEPASSPSFEKFLWPYRAQLSSRVAFGKTQTQRGLPWTAYSMFFSSRFGGLTIAFSFVATHNHFFLDREDRVFDRSSPIIKLPSGANEEEHLRLLGVLNSSTACFWLKQMSQGKGGSGLGRGVQDEGWEERYEFTGTKLQELPLPAEYPLELATELDSLAQRLTENNPAAIASSETPTRERLDEASAAYRSTHARMMALQEELDWQVYSLYGLLEDLRAPADSIPKIALGERSFEIVLARKMASDKADTQWFARHGSTPTTELPSHWPDAYKEVVRKRIEVIENNRFIGLIERPECKRRWASEGWDAMQARALRSWLLDRAESRDLWFHEVDGLEQPRLLTSAELADELQADPDFLAVAELYAPGKELTKLLAELTADEHVPYLAALRYKASGLSKREGWEDVWNRQREEDAAATEAEKKAIREAIPTPPKYTSADFLKTSYWRNRGKLDVPKERFISYPFASRDNDPALLLGWVGWDHREQAQALATLVVEREQEDGWEADQLAPVLAGLREVLPWVRQWHNEFDVAYGGSPAKVYEDFLREYANRLHLTDEALTSWRPPKGRGRAARG
ncbi:BREX-2 system adenine-specific DNA-methyltransferase PglX [Streptomyces sp. 8N114]|uniref:BREX-2 system adenine-specific DNA-methyltransferase PglX n=1 Tax=Streptomyces sp. 8N114 TaxID=3457419 RepID=UPI003FD4C865